MQEKPLKKNRKPEESHHRSGAAQISNPEARRKSRASITWTMARSKSSAHFVSELDAEGKQLRVVSFTDYTGEKVRSMYPSAAELRSKWSDAEEARRKLLPSS